MVFGMAACKKQGGDDPQSSVADDTFVIGMECNYAPFNWTQTDDSNGAVAIADGSGYADGYDIRIAKKIAEGLGKKLVVEKIEWDGLTLAVQSGKIDAIIAGMSPTQERQATIDFTDPYYETGVVMVVRKDGAYASAASLSDFAGAKVTGQMNTYHYDVIDQIEGVEKQNAMADFPSMIFCRSSAEMPARILLIWPASSVFPFLMPMETATSSGVVSKPLPSAKVMMARSSFAFNAASALFVSAT